MILQHVTTSHKQTETLKEQILPQQQELGLGKVQNIKVLPRKDVVQGS